MFTKYLDLKDVRLFYKVFGSLKDETLEIDPNQPTLIFLHGGPGVVDHSLYVPFWSKFAGLKYAAKSLQVIFMDHRGSGLSCYEKNGGRDYGKTADWNLKQWGQDVHAFISALNIRQPIIAGVSFGGVVAMSYAVQYPEELGGLILCDTDAKFDLDIVVKKFAEKVKRKGGSDAEVDLVCETVKKMFSDTTPENYANYIKYCMPYCATNPYRPDLISQCVKHEEVAFIYNRNELTAYNFLTVLNNISCDILVMCGDQNPIHSAESALKTAAAISPKHLNFTLFKNAGSPVYADEEQAVTECINTYLQKIEHRFQ